MRNKLIFILIILTSLLAAKISETKREEIKKCIVQNKIIREDIPANKIGLSRINADNEYEIYKHTSPQSRPRESLIWNNIVMQNEKAYYIPYDFNRLIYDNNDEINNEINDDNVFDMMEKFIQLSILVKIKIDSIGYKETFFWEPVIEELINNKEYYYNIEAHCSNDTLGIKAIFNIRYSNGKFIQASFKNLGGTEIDVFNGKYYLPSSKYPYIIILNVLNDRE